MERVWLDGIMNIAILGLTATSYGSLTYLKNFLPHLARLDRSNHYEIFLPAANARELDVRQANFRIHTPRWAPKSGDAARALGATNLPWILRAEGVDADLHNAEHGDSSLPRAQHYHHAECRTLFAGSFPIRPAPAGAALADQDNDGAFPAPQPQDHRHFRLGEGIPGRTFSPAAG